MSSLVLEAYVQHSNTEEKGSRPGKPGMFVMFLYEELDCLMHAARHRREGKRQNETEVEGTQERERQRQPMPRIKDLVTLQYMLHAYMFHCFVLLKHNWKVPL
jgi:hypothetical protein